MKYLVSLTLALIVLGGGISSWSQEKESPSDSSEIHFTVGPRFIHLPEGYFLLVRKGKNLGAIRLTQIAQDSEGNGSSKYESYFQSDGSGSFLNANTVRRSGGIDIKPMRGIHMFAWQPGQDKLWVGNWWFGCDSPSLVNMSFHFSEEDQGLEFAATSAKAIHEVDALNPQLRWFRYLSDDRVILPVLTLPK